MTEMDERRDPIWAERDAAWLPSYTYRRPLRGRELLPAIGVGIAAGLAAFYVARIMLQRTPLQPALRPRSARLPESRREPR